MNDQAYEIAGKVARKFAVCGDVVSYERYGSGHINDTFKLVTSGNGAPREYILQRINSNVFKNPAEVMENIFGVTEFLRRKIISAGGDPDRETMTIVKTTDGALFHVDDNGGYWRCYIFVTDSLSFNKVERPEEFYESAVAFGNFQALLAEYPADTLHETIKDFHNTPDRFKKFLDAVEQDVCGRAASVKAEIDFVKAREGFCYTFEKAREEGKLPLRVTHNDTKLNNILFDKKTNKPICIIDLDTIMPGYSVNDYGDSIRFGASTGDEDERDLSKVNFSLELFELYTKGFAEGAKGRLTDFEFDMMPYGAKMMTLECGMRFLTDYLQGDTYFKIHREGHNLDRCRTQFKLVSDMEKNWDKMREIVDKYRNV